MYTRFDLPSQDGATAFGQILILLLRRTAMVIAAAVVSGQRSQHGRHDVDRAVDGANSLCRLAETDQRDLRWVDHPEDRVNPLVTDVGHGDREVR